MVARSPLLVVLFVLGWLGWAVLSLHVLINEKDLAWFYELSYDPLAATILGGIPAGITVGMVNYVWMRSLASQHCSKCCPEDKTRC